MKKVLLLICLLVVASAAQLLAYTPITQGKYYVSTTGDDQANTGLTVGSPFRTIQFAVNQSLSPGDIILVRGGTYAEKVYISSVKNGVAGAPIVLAAYGTETPIITGVSTSVTNGFARDIEVDGSYWLLQGLTVMDSYSNPTRDLYPMHEWFWVLINGSNVHMKSCRLVYPGIVRTVADFAGGTYPLSGNDRPLVVGGDYALIDSSFVRGGAEGIIMAGKYYTLRCDTVHNTISNNIILSHGDGLQGEPTYGLVEYCLCDTAGEDNIQYQENFTNSTTQTWLVNNKICLRRNILSNAQENCVDLKATGATTTIEENLLINSRGDDQSYYENGTDTWIGYDAPDMASGGAINLGAQSFDEYVIIRNNIISGNCNGALWLPGAHIYNNDFVFNQHTYLGYTTSTGEHFDVYTYPFTFELTQRKSAINNIFYYSSASNNVHTRALSIMDVGRLNPELDYNLYYSGVTTTRFGMNYPGAANNGNSGTTYTGLTDWKNNGLSATSWLGKDAQSLEANPLFTNVPTTPAAFNYSWDFTLGASSPAIGRGRALTRTTSASNGNSKSLPVVDSYYFRDSYGGLLAADTIQIGASGTPVVIESIDYANQTIGLAALRSWSSGDSVWLIKNGVKQNQIGSLPFNYTAGPPDPGLQAPDPPILVAPVVGSEQQQPAQFKWRTSARATSYYLSAADNTTWLGEKNATITAPDTQYAGWTFTDAATVRWNVSASNTVGTSANSDTWTYITASRAITDSTIVVNWSKRVNTIALTTNTALTMSDLWGESTTLIVTNPNGKIMDWPAGVSWLGRTTVGDPGIGDTTVYYLIRDGSKVYGVVLSELTSSKLSVAMQSWVTQNFYKKTAPNADDISPTKAQISAVADTVNLFATKYDIQKLRDDFLNSNSGGGTYTLAVTDTSSTYTDPGTLTKTWTHVTTGTNGNRMMLLAVGYESATATVAAASYGIVPMTSLGVVTVNKMYVQLFKLANPTAGSAVVSVTLSEAPDDNWKCGAWTLCEVNQITPFGTFTDSTLSYSDGATVNLDVPSAAGDIVVAATTMGSTWCASSVPVVLDWYRPQYATVVGSHQAATTALTSFSWTMGDRHAVSMVGIAIKPN